MNTSPIAAQATPSANTRTTRIKVWLKEHVRDKLPMAVINAMVLGLLATWITDDWQDKRKQAEVQLSLLKEFEDRSNRLIGCMMAPRAMVHDRECLVVELDLIGMEVPFQVVFDTPFTDDFRELAQTIADAHSAASQASSQAGKVTEGSEDWVLSDPAFAAFRDAYTARVREMREKMLREIRSQ